MRTFMPRSIARFMPAEVNADLTIDNKHLQHSLRRGGCHVTANRCQFGSLAEGWQAGRLGEALRFQAPVERAFADAEVLCQLATRAAERGEHRRERI